MLVSSAKSCTCSAFTQRIAATITSENDTAKATVGDCFMLRFMLEAGLVTPPFKMFCHVKGTPSDTHYNNCLRGVLYVGYTVLFDIL